MGNWNFKTKTAFTAQLQKPQTVTPAQKAVLRPACQRLKSEGYLQPKIRIPNP